MQKDIWQEFRDGFLKGWHSYWTNYTWVWVLIGIAYGFFLGRL